MRGRYGTGALLALALFTVASLAAVRTPDGSVTGPQAQVTGFAPNPTSTPPQSRVPTRTPTPSQPPPSPTAVPPSPTATQDTSILPTEAPDDIVGPSPTATPPSLTILTPTPIIDVFDFPPDLTGSIPTATPPDVAFPGELPDLIAYEMEITQGLQSLGNHMPLVADRMTYLRVYVRTDGADYPNVKMVVEGSRAGQSLGVIPSDNQPITARADGGDRLNVNDSLYVQLPLAWLEPGTLSVQVFVYAGNPNAPFDNEPESFNNFIQTSVNLDEAAGARLSFVPIHMHDNFDGNQPEKLFLEAEPGFPAVVTGMLRHLPLPGYELYPPPVDQIYCGGGAEAGMFPGTVPIGEHGNCEFDLSVPGGAEYVTIMMALVDAFTDDAAEDLKYYGMVHPDFDPQMVFYNDQGDSISYSGLALNGQTYGVMEGTPDQNVPWTIRGARILAHEVGHALGLGHVECAGNEEKGGALDEDFPWKLEDCSIAATNPEGFYGFDVYYGVLPGVNEPTVISNDPAAPNPNLAFPLMGYKSPKWIDAYHWCIVLDEIGADCNPQSTPFQASLGRPALARGVAPWLTSDSLLDSSGLGFGGFQPEAAPFLLVTGVVQKEPLEATLGQAITLPEAPADLNSTPEIYQAETGFEVVLLDESGGVLASQQIVEATSNHERLNTIPFLLGLPLVSGTEKVEIRREGRSLAERTFSANSPEVEILTPNGGESFEAPFEVRWQASDPDGDDLTYTLQYSPDGGQSWQVLALALTDQSYQVLSLHNLTGSEQAKIRVLASDGANSGVDETDGVFTIPNTPPLANVQSPGHLAVFPQGARVPLIGSGTDREEGALAPEALSWESSVDGFLDSGDRLERSDLSPGEHVITLTAEDSAGLAGQAQVGIVIDGGRSRQVPEDELQLAARLLAAGPDAAPAAEDQPVSWLALGVFVLLGLVGLALIAPLAWRRLRR